MQLETINFIEKKLESIKKLLREDDAYYVNDLIVSHLEDEDLWSLVSEMMENFGYTESMIKKVRDIITAIQGKLFGAENTPE